MNRDHADRRHDVMQRLAAAQACIVHCAPWAAMPMTDDRRQIWDRLIKPYHDDVVSDAVALVGSGP